MWHIPVNIKWWKSLIYQKRHDVKFRNNNDNNEDIRVTISNLEITLLQIACLINFLVPKTFPRIRRSWRIIRARITFSNSYPKSFSSSRWDLWWNNLMPCRTKCSNTIRNTNFTIIIFFCDRWWRPLSTCTTNNFTIHNIIRRWISYTSCLHWHISNTCHEYDHSFLIITKTEW